MTINSARMLPRLVDALKLAEAGARLAGECPLDGMDRLDLDRRQTLPPVSAELEFERDPQGRRLVRGHIKARLPRICQRCLRPMIEDLQLPVLWALAADESEAESLDASYEAVLRADVPLALHAAVEDELLLGAALAPRHGNVADCALGSERADGWARDARQESRPNPFALLRRLKSE